MIINKLSASMTESKTKGNDDVKMRGVCQEFESVFVSYLLKSMRKTVQNNAEGDGFSREVYTSMMDEEIAKVVAKGPGIGLADTLYRQLSSKKS
ncbi:MAG: peptidoglycan hydrolase FlgJ [Candidatus Poribacteria bacterium]|nr:peptidoglycan hydrolase FlgJ [Candidatus Poribacteria bacterium]